MKHFWIKAFVSLVLAVSLMLPLTALASSGHAQGGAGAPTTHQLYTFPGGGTPPTHTNNIAAGGWSCFIATFAGKASSSSMWGQGYDNCSQNMETIDMTLTAWYCQPVLWGCIFFNQGQMGPGCTYHGISAQYCPSSGTYRRGGISGGQLWGVETATCVYAYDGSSACGDTFQEVQF